MILEDYHMHTNFCDGRDTPEDMVRSAIAMGLVRMGISGHSYTSFNGCCMTREGTAAFRKEMRRLREKYRDQIEILCGVEQDYLSDDPPEGFDYVIGSVHFLKARGHYLVLDSTPEELRQGVEEYFDGDWYAMTDAYYDCVADVVNRTRADIIGHFDLVTKFLEKAPLFDPEDPRYTAAWRRAVDALLPYGKPFELNTGAISRGWRTTPYPAEPIRRYIKDHGGKLILSSDSHRSDTIAYAFSCFEALL